MSRKECLIINDEFNDVGMDGRRKKSVEDYIQLYHTKCIEGNDGILKGYFIVKTKLDKKYVLIEESNKLFSILVPDHDLDLHVHEGVGYVIVIDITELQTSLKKRKITELILSPESFYVTSPTSSSHRAAERVFECFYRQQDCFDYYDSLSYEMKSICKQYSYEAFSESRRYLVASFDEIALQYVLMDSTSNHHYHHYPKTHKVSASSVNAPLPTLPFTPETKHLYEIIRHDYPCRAYFDVEFPIANNPDINGDDITYKLVHLVLWQVYNIWDIALGLKDVIVLDSTTADKYSKHISLIIPSPHGSREEILFRNNAAVGLFVQSLIKDFCITYDQDNKIQVKKDFECFWICNRDNKLTCFIDLGVYTKNRLFRLVWSTKYGKGKQVLRPTSKDNILYNNIISGDGQDDVKLLQIEVLKKCFVVPYDVYKNAASSSSDDGNIWDLGKISYLSMSHSAGVKRMSSFAALPMTNDCSSAAASGGLARDKQLMLVGRYCHSDMGNSSIWNADKVIDQGTTSSSPYPLLDSFILLLACKGGKQGKISSWDLYSTGKSPYFRYKLRYQITGNKWCDNINREHKSNHIFYEVDFHFALIVQKCWDPDCRDYTSFPINIDASILPAYADLSSRHLDVMIAKSIMNEPSKWK